MYGAMRCLLSNEVGLPRLEPGQEGTVMVTFIAPPDFGEYYRLVMTQHVYNVALVLASILTIG